MKQILFIIVFFFIYLTRSFAQKIPIIIHADGKVMNRDRQLGKLTSEGGFDQNGESVSRLESSGITVDSTGKILGDVAKGGNLTYLCNGVPQRYIIVKSSKSNNYMIKNTKGKTYILLNKRYKNQAISAIHFIYENTCVL
jgi:hypothetical protein